MDRFRACSEIQQLSKFHPLNAFNRRKLTQAPMAERPVALPPVTLGGGPL
jgi:hypothetical protein